jgi:hypothetical protein
VAGTSDSFHVRLVGIGVILSRLHCATPQGGVGARNAHTRLRLNAVGELAPFAARSPRGTPIRRTAPKCGQVAVVYGRVAFSEFGLGSGYLQAVFGQKGTFCHAPSKMVSRAKADDPRDETSARKVRGEP